MIAKGFQSGETEKSSRSWKTACPVFVLMPAGWGLPPGNAASCEMARRMASARRPARATRRSSRPVSAGRFPQAGFRRPVSAGRHGAYHIRQGYSPNQRVITRRVLGTTWLRQRLPKSARLRYCHSRACWTTLARLIVAVNHYVDELYLSISDRLNYLYLLELVLFPETRRYFLSISGIQFLRKSPVDLDELSDQ